MRIGHYLLGKVIGSGSYARVRGIEYLNKRADTS